MFFVCDCILENRHTSPCSSRASLSLTCPAVFRVRKFFCQIQLYSRSMFSYWTLHPFSARQLSLSTGRYEIILTALISESSRPSDTPGARRLSILSVRQKSEIPSACSVPARPHLPPILGRSGVGNHSCSESAKLLLANGLISHPRSFGFFFSFPFPSLGPRMAPIIHFFHNGLVNILQMALFISIGKSVGI